MPAFVAWVGTIRWPASSNSNPASRWSDLLRTTVRWDHWASAFCRTASNSARSMIEGCSRLLVLGLQVAHDSEGLGLVAPGPRRQRQRRLPREQSRGPGMAIPLEWRSEE